MTIKLHQGLAEKDIPESVIPIKMLEKGFYCAPVAIIKAGIARVKGFKAQNTREGFVKELIDRVNSVDYPVTLKNNVSSVVCEGLIGIDLDVKNGKDGKRQFANLKAKYGLPEANLIVKTKSGGEHHYYKVPEGLAHVKSSVDFIDKDGQEYPGVDIRSGNSLLFCFTCKESPYQIIKDETDSINDLVELEDDHYEIFYPLNENKVSEAPKPGMSSLISNTPIQLVEGNRNKGLYDHVCLLIGKGCLFDEIVEEAHYINQNSRPPMEDREVTTIVESAWNTHAMKPKESAIRGVRERFLYYPSSNKAFLIDLYASATSNSHYAVNVALQAFAHQHSLPFRDFYGHEPEKASDNKPVNLIQYAMANGLIRHVSQIGYRPGMPRYLKVDEYADTSMGLSVAYMYNSYVSPALSDPGCCSEESQEYCKDWFDIALHLCSNNSKDLDLFLDWLAYLVQNPDQKISFAPYFVSYQGSGRGTIGSIIKHLVGESNNAQVSHHALISNFNADTSCKKLLWIDELPEFIAQGDYGKFISTFNNLVTEATSRREMKGIDASHVENYACVMMSTNYETSIKVNSGTRRVMPFIQMNKMDGRPGPEVYARLNLLVTNMSKSDLASVKRVKTYVSHLNNFLMKRDISKFRAKDFAPVTSSTSRIIEDSNSTLYRLLEVDVAQKRGVFISDITTVEAILAHCMLYYPDRKWSETAILRLESNLTAGCSEGTLLVEIRRTDNRKRVISHPRIAPFAKDYPFIMLEKSFQSGRKIPSMYCVRNFDYWIDPSIKTEQIVKEYAKLSGTTRDVGLSGPELLKEIEMNRALMDECDSYDD